ncbi:MAG: type II toxin-antitoxin system HicA family toxin [Armatimonadetes bacterium]|nr:type II toxin-antitoxin system HicA family toxin [Armatimonadota bacterium]
MKVRAVIKRIEDDGWYRVRMRGSHRQFRHPAKPGVVTIAGHPNKDMHPETLRSVWRQAQIGD